MYDNSLNKDANKHLLGSSFHVYEPINNDVTTAFYIKSYMSLCRGFQLRNWTRVRAQLKRIKCPKDVLNQIYHSWVKLKFARALRPHMQMTYVYIMKHFSDLEGQKIYDDCYEQFTEQPYETTMNFYRSYSYDTRYIRLMEYFYHEDPKWILPLSVFPLIDVDKSRMSLSEVPHSLNADLIREVQEKVFNYVFKLGVKSLFVPSPDTMAKYGNQRYNDGGTVSYDWERPKVSFDSSFLYQRFLTQPLTPREVWLPGKAIKQNNAFFMNIHRQLLIKDKVYPSGDLSEIYDVIFKKIQRDCIKFDISGFGFQYPRELLIAGNNAIRELYPCSYIEEQSEIFESILNNVSVTMPNGDVKRPVRGIGLGYYEDLKTIVLLAIINEYFPLSVYGDQGLVEERGTMFAFDLMKYSFIMNPDKVEVGLSEGRIRWGGCVFEHSQEPFRPREYSDNIFGAFFSREHWERKSSLYSFYKSYPEQYKHIEPVISIMYHRYYGHEFFRDERYSSFLEGGLSSKQRSTGICRTYKIRSHMTPSNPLVYDPIYSTPFSLVNQRVTNKESKEFQKKRKKLYRGTKINDGTLFDYVNPLIEFNKKVPLPVRPLPRWADLSMILNHNSTSGAITSGLKGQDIFDAVNRQHFCSDPFRAKATGGYKFLTSWRSSRPPSAEWLETAELLMECDSTERLLVNRADLYQNFTLAEDPMYYNDDLFINAIKYANKRKRTVSNHSFDITDTNNVAKEVRNMIPQLIKRRKIQDLSNVITLVNQELNKYDPNYTELESNHGDYDADDDYYADAIDLVDLE